MESDVPLSLQIGQVLARDYRVMRGLAAGGMGSVYLVEQLSTGKQRALKVMHPQFARDEESRQRFAQEAKAGARIRSEHVVEVVAAGIDDDSGIPWLAMELLDGEELSARMKRAGRLPFSEVLEIFRQLGHGLGEAHRSGLVHRDLKPENLFIAVARRQDAPFTLKILDFGVAKLAQESQTQTEGTRPVGTPRWMAPEQSEEKARITPATDVWAMGLIAFYLLTGRYYWRAANSGGSLTTLLRELVLEPIESPSLRAAQFGLERALPPGFDDWFLKCVARDVKTRFANADEALRALAPLLEKAPPSDIASIPVISSARGVESPARSGDEATLAPVAEGTTPGSLTNPKQASTGTTRPASSPAFGAQPPRGAATIGARPASSPALASSAPPGSGEEGTLNGPTLPSRPASVQSGSPAPGAAPGDPRAGSQGDLHAPPQGSLVSRLALGAVVLLIVVALALALRSRTAAPKSGPAPAAAASPAPAPAPVAPSAPSEPASFVFLIDSLPSGADVFEGDANLGSTPLQLSMQNAPLHQAPRRFRIVKEGYQPFSLVQGPSNEGVKVIETLGPAEPEAQRPQQRKPKHETGAGGDEPELRMRR